MTDSNYPAFFTAAEDSRMNACLNFLHDMSAGYIDGYLRAADHLVGHVAETGREQDFLVYPIAFMYRQHVELQLKKIIDKGRQLLTDKGGHPTHHKLENLWPVAKGILRQTWDGEPDPPEFGLIDHFVDEFVRIDPDSTAFRYPKQKAGGSSLPMIQQINLRHLAECIHSFSSFLDGAACGIDHYLDCKREAEREAYY